MVWFNKIQKRFFCAYGLDFYLIITFLNKYIMFLFICSVIFQYVFIVLWRFFPMIFVCFQQSASNSTFQMICLLRRPGGTARRLPLLRHFFFNRGIFFVAKFTLFGIFGWIQNGFLQSLYLRHISVWCDSNRKIG